MERILEIEDLRKYYGRQPNQTKALDGMSFQVLKGEFLGIMGSSGSGKSTLLNCIASVTRPTGGRIVMREQEIQRLRNENARLKQEWRQKQNEADAQFQKDCVAYASGTLGITEKQGSVLFGYAYEKGHANGYYDVLSELQDLIDMMEKFLS